MAGRFFFDESKRGIKQRFPNLYGKPDVRAVKAGVKNLTKEFGWYLTLKDIAESGMFNRAGLTPIESAEVAPLYDAFHYLSAKAAETDFKNRLIEMK